MSFERIRASLSDEELYIFKRGRNANPATVPKNADIGDYRTATGLEALMGYLFLTGQTERIGALMGIIMNNDGGAGPALSGGDNSDAGGLEQ